MNNDAQAILARVKVLEERLQRGYWDIGEENPREPLLKLVPKLRSVVEAVLKECSGNSFQSRTIR